MKAKRDEAQRLRPFVFISFGGLLMWMIFTILMPMSSRAQPQPQYMYIRESPHGFDWYCLDDLPYGEIEDSPEQTEPELESLVHQLPDLQLRGYLIQVASCNLDMLLDDPYGYSFAWRFTSHNTDGHASHRHMTRGAVWIQYLSVDLSGN